MITTFFVNIKGEKSIQIFTRIQLVSRPECIFYCSSWKKKNHLWFYFREKGLLWLLLYQLWYWETTGTIMILNALVCLDISCWFTACSPYRHFLVSLSNCCLFFSLFKIHLCKSNSKSLLTGGRWGSYFTNKQKIKVNKCLPNQLLTISSRLH